MDNPIAVLIMSFLAIILGIIFIVNQSANKPIERQEAVLYTGDFDSYKTHKKYCEIYFEDGTYYDVYPHTESQEFREKMKSLEKGTRLYILVNPNNDYVVEVKTQTEELLNFEKSQQEIDAYDNGYIWLGILCLFCSAFLIAYTVISIKYKRKEIARHAAKKEIYGDTCILRCADLIVKSRTLLEATVGEYHISYRRVKNVNELVINGYVYDEKKGVLEFAHKLCANIDGHNIEVGYDDESYSYIMFDEEIIERKLYVNNLSKYFILKNRRFKNG